MNMKPRFAAVHRFPQRTDRCCWLSIIPLNYVGCSRQRVVSRNALGNHKSRKTSGVKPENKRVSCASCHMGSGGWGYEGGAEESVTACKTCAEAVKSRHDQTGIRWEDDIF